MCWMCDHPTASYNDYLDHLRRLIAEHCWAVQGVERDGLRPPYAYTLGLTEHGKPELVVTGMPVRRAAELLNSVAAHVVHAAAPVPGEVIPWGDGSLIEIVEVAVPAVHLLVAVEFYGPDLRALQVVHADDRGHWPWDVGYRGVRGGQPLLGTRAGSPTRA